MKRIKKSFVAWSFLGALVSFSLLYLVLPYEGFMNLSLAVAFGACFAATIRYGRDALIAFRSGKSGAEFLIVAVFAIVSVLLGQRIWGITLRVFDRPDWLVNSPVAIFVPWMVSWAISLALLAPDIDAESSRSGIWKSVALFVGGALAGFVVASSFATAETKSAMVIGSVPTCGNYIVGTRSKKYHTADSRYIKLVVPHRCFASEDEAKAAGYAMVR